MILNAFTCDLYILTTMPSRYFFNFYNSKCKNSLYSSLNKVLCKEYFLKSTFLTYFLHRRSVHPQIFSMLLMHCIVCYLLVMASQGCSNHMFLIKINPLLVSRKTSLLQRASGGTLVFLKFLDLMFTHENESTK